MLFWLRATRRLFLSIARTMVHDCMDVWLLGDQHFGLSRGDQKEVNNIKTTKKQVGKKTKMVIIFALLRLHFCFLFFIKMPRYCIWAFMTCIIYLMYPFYSVSIGADFLQSFLIRVLSSVVLFSSKMWFFLIRFWTIATEQFLKSDW